MRVYAFYNNTILCHTKYNVACKAQNRSTHSNIIQRANCSLCLSLAYFMLFGTLEMYALLRKIPNAIITEIYTRLD